MTKSGIPRSQTKGKFRSKFERSVSEYLRSKGIKFKYESTTVNYLVYGRNWIVCPKCGPIKAQIVRKYTPDFELFNGLFLETKGRLLAKDRSKMIAVKTQHPEMDIRFVFMYDNTITEGKKKERYSEWAERNGFKWCVKKIPDEWLQPIKRKRPTWREVMGDDSSNS